MYAFIACPEGWFRYATSCYLFVTSSMNWDAAMTNCDASEQFNSNLVKIDNECEGKFIRDHIQNDVGKSAHIYFLATFSQKKKINNSSPKLSQLSI